MRTTRARSPLKTAMWPFRPRSCPCWSDALHTTRRWRNTQDIEFAEVVVLSSRMTDLIDWGEHTRLVISDFVGTTVLRLIVESRHHQQAR